MIGGTEAERWAIGIGLTVFGLLLGLLTGLGRPWYERKRKQARAVWPRLKFGMTMMSGASGKSLILKIWNEGPVAARGLAGEMTGHKGPPSWPSVCFPGRHNVYEVLFADDRDPIFASRIENPHISVCCRDSLGFTHQWRIPLQQQAHPAGGFTLIPDHQKEIAHFPPGLSVWTLWRKRRELEGAAAHE